MMKPARRVEILKTEAGEFYGFVFGASEARPNIDSLCLTLGIPIAGPLGGLDRRRMAESVGPEVILSGEGDVTSQREVPMKRNPSRTRWAEVTERVRLLCVSRENTWRGGSDSRLDNLLRLYGTNYENREVTGAWDEGGFILIAHSDHAKEMLAELENGLRSGDFAVWIDDSNNRVRHGGLTVAMASRVPLTEQESMERKDRDQAELKAAAADTGIEQRLKAAGKKWHALKPSWAGDLHDTAHKVIFFLNPADQRIYEHGWFTVEQLDAWIEGHGPVLKSASAAARIP